MTDLSNTKQNSQKETDQAKKKRLEELRGEVLKWIDQKRARKKRLATSSSYEKEVPASPEEATKKRPEVTQVEPNVLRFAIILILVVIFVGGTILIIFGIGLYKFNWDNQITDKVIKIIPYPALIVDWRPLRLSSYREDAKTLERFYEKQKELGNGVPKILTSSEIKENVAKKMVKDYFIEKLAQKYDLSLSEEEVDQELQEIVDEAGSLEEVESVLRELYNWDSQLFKEKVLKFDLLKRKLGDKILEDETLEQKDINIYLENLVSSAKILKLVD